MTDIKEAFLTSSSRPEGDVHVQMMEASYESVPRSWYAGIGVSMLAAAVYVITFYPMQLPIWGLFLSLLVALVFLPACGIIAATTGTVIGSATLVSRRQRLTIPCRPQCHHRVHRWFPNAGRANRECHLQMLWLYGVRAINDSACHSSD